MGGSFRNDKIIHCSKILLNQKGVYDSGQQLICF